MSSVVEECTPNDVIMQYIIIRKDLIKNLKWSLGSVVTQGAHAAVAAVSQSISTHETVMYLKDIQRMHKVTLQTESESGLKSVSATLSRGGVGHYSWVEQPEGITTAIATDPALKSRVSPYLGHLKLLR
eukprot:GHVR01068621.1.p1 GENE.GHVR01068621.1~~GHVR01068621.1.p1  ORF type:complete len:129 (+),score=23.32 GHVR01068621.1:52-438(+)